MSKIICDICGTSYADTASQCPICGTVRPTEMQSAPDEDNAPEYTYVKGGRFSKGNVRKRNSGREYSEADKPSGTKIGLIVVLIALILIVIAIAAYVVITLTGGNQGDSVTEPAPSQTVTNPCQAIVLPQKEIRLENVGDTILLNVRKSPVNSTDSLVFRSSDPDVVTVDDLGNLKAMKDGTATIIITCGDVMAECQVTVGKIEEPPVLQLDRQEIIFDKQGDTWQFFTGDIVVSDIQWSSDDEGVALISDGLVVAVGEGQTVIHAVYGEHTASCIIKCDFSSEGPDISGGIGEDIGDLGGSGGIGEDIGDLGGSGGGIGEDGGNSGASQNIKMYTTFGQGLYNDYLNAYDVTINAGDRLSFYLHDDNGRLSSVAWSLPEGTTCCRLGEVSNDTDNVLYALAPGNAYLSGSYNGQTIKCYIRVR